MNRHRSGRTGREGHRSWTEDGRPATRLTFSGKVRVLELQERALGFLQQELEVRGSEAAPIRIVHQEIA